MDKRTQGQLQFYPTLEPDTKECGNVFVLHFLTFCYRQSDVQPKKCADLFKVIVFFCPQAKGLGVLGLGIHNTILANTKKK